MCRNYLHENGNVRKVYNIQGAETMGQVERTIPRIYAALEDHHADHQSTVFEVEGEISKQCVSILIDPGSTPSLLKLLRFVLLRN